MYALELLKSCLDFKSTEDLVRNIDDVIELSRDDVERILVFRGWYFLDFDALYRKNGEMLKKTLNKKHLRSVRMFYEADSIDFGVRWLIRRMVSNIKNIAIEHVYGSYQITNALNPWHIDNEIEGNEWEVPKENIAKGLKEVFLELLDEDVFDSDEYVSLCTKYGFKAEEIIGYDPTASPKIKAEQTAGGNRQLVLMFDPND